MNLLVVVTTAVGCYLAAGTAGLLERPVLLLHALVGTALTAAGASVLNMYVERDLDRNMPRTRNRPLPTSQLSPAFALAFGVALGPGGHPLAVAIRQRPNCRPWFVHAALLRPALHAAEDAHAPLHAGRRGCRARFRR